MPALPKDMVWTVVKTGMSARAEVKTPPRFKAGDRVVARHVNPERHTRLPRYIRGKRGVVRSHHGGFAFADTRAHKIDLERQAGTARQIHHHSRQRFVERNIGVAVTP